MPQPGIECNMLPPSVCIQNTGEILKWQDFKTKQEHLGTWVRYSM